jgi:hypothetical protein
MRTLAMPKAAEPWSLTSLREKLIKIGAKVAGTSMNGALGSEGADQEGEVCLDEGKATNSSPARRADR